MKSFLSIDVQEVVAQAAAESANEAATTSDTHLAVIIPALNEDKTIRDVISSVPQEMAGVDRISVIVIDDGSTDTTVEQAESVGALVVSHPENRGVGAAFHSGLKAALAAGATYIVNIDADGQFNPADIPTLLQPLQEGRAEFVTATRFADPALVPDMPRLKRIGNWGMVQIINFLTGKKFTDVSCGFRAYTRDVALKLTLFGHFTYTQETFIDLAFKQVAMTEVSLKIRGEREHGKSRVANNLWKYGTKAATIIFHAARDYRPFLFIGVPGVLLIGIGLAFGLFLLWHYLQTGQTTPYRSALAVSAIFLAVGFIVEIAWMLADTMRRNRQVLEETLYLTRKSYYRNNS